MNARTVPSKAHTAGHRNHITSLQRDHGRRQPIEIGHKGISEEYQTAMTPIVPLSTGGTERSKVPMFRCSNEIYHSSYIIFHGIMNGWSENSEISEFHRKKLILRRQFDTHKGITLRHFGVGMAASQHRNRERRPPTVRMASESGSSRYSQVSPVSPPRPSCFPTGIVSGTFTATFSTTDSPSPASNPQAFHDGSFLARHSACWSPVCWPNTGRAESSSTGTSPGCRTGTTPNQHNHTLTPDVRQLSRFDRWVRCGARQYRPVARSRHLGWDSPHDSAPVRRRRQSLEFGFDRTP